MTGRTVRIAMWSGPRNISTAMMRSWGNRADTAVWDEPYYAAYLKRTGLDHPGRDEILRVHDSDWRSVTARILGPTPGGKAIFFLKLMTHHMLPDMKRDWFAHARHVFLIRDPESIIRSYAATRPDFAAEDLGLIQQRRLFTEATAATGETPPVIAAEDVLADPRALLTALCGRLGVPFTDDMLSWAPGTRSTDGVWAKHWYASVERSTGFAAPAPSPHPFPKRHRALLNRLRPHHEALSAHKLPPGRGA